MSQPTGKRKRMITDKQARTAQGIADRVAGGELLSRELIVSEHLKHYDVKDGKRTAQSKAGIIAAQNMAKPTFLAQLGLTDPQSQEALKEILWAGALGTHPLWPRDKQFSIECMKLLAKGAIATREQVVHSTTGDMDSKSIPELKYFETHDRWPNPEELQKFIVDEYKGHGKPQ